MTRTNLPLCLVALFVAFAPVPVLRAGTEGTWLKELGDPDPHVREAARVDLYALKPKDLPDLFAATAALQKAKALPPAAVGMLKGVVRQIFATAAVPDLPPNRGPDAPPPGRLIIRGGIVQNAPMPGAACLGISLPLRNFGAVRAGVINGPNGPQAMQGPSEEPYPVGAIVQERLPGFAAYGPLMTGDQIVGLDGPPAVALPDSDSLLGFILSRRPGEKLPLLISRAGKIERVTVELSVRPNDLASDYLNAEAVRRKRIEADAYWRAKYAPLLGLPDEPEPADDFPNDASEDPGDRAIDLDGPPVLAPPPRRLLPR